MSDQDATGIHTLSSAESYAAQRGVKLTATDREAILKAQKAEIRRQKMLWEVYQSSTELDEM
jgi:hypothetical protein